MDDATLGRVLDEALHETDHLVNSDGGVVCHGGFLSSATVPGRRSRRGRCRGGRPVARALELMPRRIPQPLSWRPGFGCLRGGPAGQNDNRHVEVVEAAVT